MLFSLFVLGLMTSSAFADVPHSLAHRIVLWQPAWRPWARGELEAVSRAIVDGCDESPWPDAERCQDWISVLAFRESSFHPRVIARGGAVGLLQLHGAALAGVPVREALDPTRNVRLGLAWLRHASEVCGGNEEKALSLFMGHGCRRSSNARLVIRWADEIRRTR